MTNFQSSYASPEKHSDGAAEVIGVKTIKFLNSIGILRARASLPTEELAKAMINIAKRNESGTHSIKGEDIRSAKNLTRSMRYLSSIKS